MTTGLITSSHLPSFVIMMTCPKCLKAEYVRAGTSYCGSTGMDKKTGQCKRVISDGQQHAHLQCGWCDHQWVATSEVGESATTLTDQRRPRKSHQYQEESDL